MNDAFWEGFQKEAGFGDIVRGAGKAIKKGLTQSPVTTAKTLAAGAKNTANKALGKAPPAKSSAAQNFAKARAGQPSLMQSMKKNPSSLKSGPSAGTKVREAIERGMTRSSGPGTGA